MKLLIITQKVDQKDDNLSFFIDWINEFAKHCEKVSVICLYKGQYNLPENVQVYSLGKEEKQSRVQYISMFYKYIWQLRHEYDSVFVHMNPEYIVLGAFLWKVWSKKIGLWYTHHSVTVKLRMAVKMVDMIFTPVAESFRLKTKTPILITGHGINTDKFQPRQKAPHETLNILSDTRIARSKHAERSLEISRRLKQFRIKHTINIVGGPIMSDDKIFWNELKDKINRDNLSVNLIGPVPYNSLPSYYQQADIFINHANPGGLNKVLLQAMACNLYALTSNEAYRGVLDDEQIVEPDPQSFVDKILLFVKKPIHTPLREKIINYHSLPALITKILGLYR